MNVIFSGGPANGQMLEIPDNLQYCQFPFMPELKWMDHSDDLTRPSLQKVSYRKTNYIDAHGLVVFEFEGIV